MIKRLITLAFILVGLNVHGQKNEYDFVMRVINKDIAKLADDGMEGREAGTEGQMKAAAYIEQRFEDLKLLPKGTDGYYQDFTRKPDYNPHDAVPADTTKPLLVRNVIGYLDNQAPYTVVIGAHYDHLGHGAHGSMDTSAYPAIHNGADDNASGVAGILALVPLLRHRYTANNYLIIAFSGEEKGLWGSAYFVQNSTIDMDKINYMINLDMVGRLNTEKKLAIYGTGTSPAWQPILDKISVDSISITTSESGIGASDHSSFYLDSIPVLHFFTGQHEDYHRPTDDINKINFKGEVSVIKYILEVIANAEPVGKLEYNKTKDEDSKKAPKYSVTLGVMPDYLFDGKGMRISGVKEGKPAEQAGIVKGDIVVRMGDYPVPGMRGYMEALGHFKKGDSTTVVVKRGDKELKLAVTF